MYFVPPLHTPPIRSQRPADVDEGDHCAGIMSGLTAVAVDKDKNSLQAVKWAVDHLLINSPTIILIHVWCRPHNTQNESGSHAHAHAHAHSGSEAEITQLFLPYRGFCARKKLQLKEVALEDIDISKAIIDYINANHIQNIVVGASNRNALTRKFRNPDVPTCLNKSAPEFCAVYVIYKGKPVSVRSAKTSAPVSAAPPRHLLPSTNSHQPPESDGSSRPGARGNWRGMVPPSPLLDRRSFERPDHMKTPSSDKPTSRTPNNNMHNENQDSSIRLRRSSVDSHDSFSEDFDFHVSSSGTGSLDFGDSFEFSSTPNDSPRGSHSPVDGPQREVEAEMRRLRLELKQTMDMYNAACKEAVTANQKAKELNQWKVQEARKFEELRRAEEAALRIAEMEKAKCKTAIESAEAAQRIAQLETQKRLNAELKAKRDAEEKKRALGSLAHTDLRYRKYTIEEIEIATDYFHASKKIGEGGYGPVYKASLDHTPVAIKVLRPDAAQGRKQFQQEVEVLSCIRHPNMVLLLGACPEYGCLVYEHMNNGSLDDRLFRRGNTPPIPWTVRFRISAEIATGLLFLHQTKPEPLVHRDLKPANILLDRNYTCKISDVGLARLVPPSVADSVTQYHMTSTAGTFCYIDPEYQQTGMLGVKSDIYSLGIMLLQIITAKPPMGLTHHVERAIDKGTFKELLDPAVTDWPVKEALIYAKLALKCAELRRRDRPDLGTVVLPELDRLRNLGNEYEDNHGSNTGYNFGNAPYSYSSNHQQPQSLTHQRSASPPNISAP